MYSNRFFGFTYQFPTGWAVLSAEAARAIVEIGGNVISTGDPTEQDLKKVARTEGHQLLYVMENRAANQPISGRTVMVSAIEMQPAPITAESYVKALGQRLSQIRGALELKGSPEERVIGGRSFWKQDILVHTASGTAHGAQFVTTEKGYVLMFCLSYIWSSLFFVLFVNLSYEPKPPFGSWANSVKTPSCFFWQVYSSTNKGMTETFVVLPSILFHVSRAC
jgi:hypothetical protein